MELRDADDDGPDYRRDDSFGTVSDSGIGKRTRRTEEGGNLADAGEENMADSHGGNGKGNVPCPAEIPHIERRLVLQREADLKTGVAHGGLERILKETPR